MPYADETREGGKKRKKVVVKLPKPKHAEMYTTRECALFQPLRVVLQVLPRPNADPVPYEIYLRAATPDDAMWTAYQIFNAWEHPSEYKDGGEDYNPYRDGLFPQIFTGQDPASVGYKITEEDWDAAWKDVQTYGVVNGNSILRAPQNDHPSIFRLSPKDWKGKPGLILTPGMGDIAMVERSRVKTENDEEK